jgi:glycosyltransferase involved in cell wall biosynthesis
MKVLFWTKEIEIKDAGGPAGYCYNIKHFLESSPCEEIDFYPSKKENGVKSKIRQWIMNHKYVYFFVAVYWEYFRKSPLSSDDQNLLSRYDCVHVHSICDMMKTFSIYKGRTRVILTTHTPEPFIDEFADECGMKFLLDWFPCLRRILISREVAALKRSDYIMFPVQEAREVYEKKSRCYKVAFEQMKNRMFFVPTAVCDMEVNNDSSVNVLPSIIPANAIKVCFIGRHNKIKGYDFLKKIAHEIWKTNENVYFIIGGKQGPLKKLNDPRWIELGWVKTADLLKEIDLFILPNQETFFDLILLETLRQGVPVLLTETGGNKWFINQHICGIYSCEYGNACEAAHGIQDFIQDKQNGITLNESIKNFYKKNLSMPRFISQYLSMLKNEII